MAQRCLLSAAAAAAAIAASAMVGAALAQAPVPVAPAAPLGVADAQLAWQHWTLNCQGCHRPDATGSAATTPSLAGTAARFLWVPGGREYLARVPGVATSALSNEDLAEVLNWLLWRFDKDNLPSNFQPFSAAEVGELRTRPLRLEASQMRADLLQKAEASGRP